MNNVVFSTRNIDDFINDVANEVVKKIGKRDIKPPQPNEYLTRQEVAKMFNVDISTISNWQKSGKLKPLGIGARVYFLRSDIEQSLIPLNV